jgi:hypothetical protein
MNCFFANIARFPDTEEGFAHPWTVNPAARLELGSAVPHETKSFAVRSESAVPNGPAATAAEPAAVPPLPLAEASAGSTEFMRQTPLYSAQIFVDGIGVLAKGAPYRTVNVAPSR